MSTYNYITVIFYIFNSVYIPVLLKPYHRLASALPLNAPAPLPSALAAQKSYFFTTAFAGSPFCFRSFLYAVSCFAGTLTVVFAYILANAFAPIDFEVSFVVLMVMLLRPEHPHKGAYSRLWLSSPCFSFRVSILLTLSSILSSVISPLSTA